MKEIDLRRVADVLRQSGATKGEYESTDQFLRRVQPRLAEKSMDGELVFSAPIPASKLSYDADRQIMRVGDSILGPLETEMAVESSVVISVDQRQTGSYVGENAFGVKRNITVSEERKVVAVVPGGVSSAWPKDFAPIDQPLSRDLAKTARLNLVVLFVGRLRAPFYETRDRSFSPKVNIPVDVKTRVDIVHFDLDCALLYHRGARLPLNEIPFRRH